MPHSKPQVVADPHPRQQQLRAEVVLLGVVVEARVIAADLEERVAADRGAAADDDLRQPARFACAVGQEDLRADRGDIVGRLGEHLQVTGVQRVGVVIEHDQPFALRRGRAVVSRSGAVVGVETHAPQRQAVVELRRQLNGRPRGVVDDEDLGTIVCVARQGTEGSQRLPQGARAVMRWQQITDQGMSSR